MNQSTEEINQKRRHELFYWTTTYNGAGNTLSNGHYKYFYTTMFGKEKSFYQDKKVLDIGCGPRGSLEWADNAGERVGLDPLADSYKQLGTAEHQMSYVNSRSEDIPFPDNYFDIICSFNSLDHVDDLEKTISEIKRVLSIKGYFFLITDVNHKPTIAEPISFGWNIVDSFTPEFRAYNLQHYEKAGNGMYASIRNEREPYDHSNRAERYGVLAAAFRKYLD